MPRFFSSVKALDRGFSLPCKMPPLPAPELTGRRSPRRTCRRRPRKSCCARSASGSEAGRDRLQVPRRGRSGTLHALPLGTGQVGRRPARRGRLRRARLPARRPRVVDRRRAVAPRAGRSGARAPHADRGPARPAPGARRGLGREGAGGVRVGLRFPGSRRGSRVAAEAGLPRRRRTARSGRHVAGAGGDRPLDRAPAGLSGREVRVRARREHGLLGRGERRGSLVHGLGRHRGGAAIRRASTRSGSASRAGWSIGWTSQQGPALC